jgi:uncharacterized protein (TIGR03437 family)
MDGHRSAYAVFGPPLGFRPVNAASYLANPIFDLPGTAVAPLEILTLFGVNLGPSGLETAPLGSDGRLPTTLSGTRVLFDNVPAPILYVSSGQASVIVPGSVVGRASTTITVERNGLPSAAALADVIPALPALFTADASGRGQVAAANQDGSYNSRARPAAPGSVVVLYATGAGLLDRAVPDGGVAGLDLARPAAEVAVRIGGRPAEVLYAGSAPGLVHGAVQINARVPDDLLGGDQPVHVIAGEWASPPGTTLAVQ